jgi:hypothetical protein
MAEPFVHRLRVRYGECDPQGVVFHPQYLALADHALTELYRERFGGYTEMLNRGVDVVVAGDNRFRASARFDEELDIAIAVAHLGDHVDDVPWRDHPSRGRRAARRDRAALRVDRPGSASRRRSRTGRGTGSSRPPERRSVLLLGRLARPNPEQVVKRAREHPFDGGR